MRIILISGQAEHGKDYVANTLAAYLSSQNKHVKFIHFADLVKYVCKEYYFWDGKKDIAGRTLLQQIGTDRRLNFDPSIWADITTRLAAFIGFDCDYVLVPDWRFIVQYNTMRRQFSDDLIAVRVNRWQDPNYTIPYQNHLTSYQRSHPSESELLGKDYLFDYKIDNYSNPQYNNNEELIKQLQTMINEVEKND